MDQLFCLALLLITLSFISCHPCDEDNSARETHDEMTGIFFRDRKQYEISIISNISYIIKKPANKNIYTGNIKRGNGFLNYYFLENSTKYSLCNCSQAYLAQERNGTYKSRIYSNEPFILTKNNIYDSIYCYYSEGGKCSIYLYCEQPLHSILFSLKLERSCAETLHNYNLILFILLIFQTKLM